MDDDGVVASALEVVEIAEAAALLRAGDHPFSAAERAFARGKSDPERRLAARLAAKRAAARLLGIGPEEVEVLRERGQPPRLRLSDRGLERLAAAGADGTCVSLTHGRTHAAASVLLLNGGRR